jgi:hypothetical protein
MSQTTITLPDDSTIEVPTIGIFLQELGDYLEQVQEIFDFGLDDLAAGAAAFEATQRLLGPVLAAWVAANVAVANALNDATTQVRELRFGNYEGASERSIGEAVAPLESVPAPDLSELSTALDNILAELQKIGICTCVEEKGGSDAGTGTGPAIPGVTRLSADASAFVFQIGKFLSELFQSSAVRQTKILTEDLICLTE